MMHREMPRNVSIDEMRPGLVVTWREANTHGDIEKAGSKGQLPYSPQAPTTAAQGYTHELAHAHTKPA
jgi:hypothetical protein